MNFIQIGKVELPKFITTTNVKDEDGYTYVEAPKYDPDEEVHIY